MPKDNKFNPIVQLPMLPGAEVASEEAVANLVDSTYPPKAPHISVHLKGARRPEPEEVIVEKEEGKNMTVIRAVILVGLIVLVIFGIFLTLNLVPKLASSVSGFSKAFTSIFVSNKPATPATTGTSTQAVATAQPAATSTAQTVATVPVANQSTATQPATAPVKTPAKIVPNILATNAIGNRVTVVFNIQNNGGTTSGPWSFSATLPSSQTPTYYSVAQAPLAPKSGVIYTLGFNASQDLPVQIAVYTK
jgi:hypothetical protein